MGNPKEKFDFYEKPKKPNFFWNGLEHLVAPFQTMSAGGKIKKVNCEGLKPPYLALSNHGCMIDFPMMLNAVFPHTVNWVTALDGFVGREYVSRSIGMVCKRKFTNEIVTARHILNLLTKEKTVVALYPEARWSICGVNERLDKAIGKLVKIAGCPVVSFIEDGNFLLNPQWDIEHKRKVKVSATMTQIVTKEEAKTLTAAEIQERIEKAFHFDQYEWQYKNKVKINSKYRANNLHRVLYQCPHCKEEFSTYAKFTKIWCENCGKVWEMDEYGRLHCENGEDIYSHVPDWYRWERQNVREEVRAGKYSFSDDARLEVIKSTYHGFVPLGTVKLTHGYDGFKIEGEIDGKPLSFSRDALLNYSCHIEYDFQRRGDCMEFCAPEDTYYVFPLNKKNYVTKMHLATEELFDYLSEKRSGKE
ncbi:MAG: hypothetical protein J6126_02535 [Clostridia bacterium]|nr:hypothetical protein [Clostridia bacterium]